MRICPNCKGRIENDDARFCRYCGKELPAITVGRTAVDSPPERQGADNSGNPTHQTSDNRDLLVGSTSRYVPPQAANLPMEPEAVVEPEPAPAPKPEPAPVSELQPVAEPLLDADPDPEPVSGPTPPVPSVVPPSITSQEPISYVSQPYDLPTPPPVPPVPTPALSQPVYEHESYPEPTVESLNLWTATAKVFSNYFKFKGRASRAEFWWFNLFSVLVFLFTAFLGGITEGDPRVLIIIIGYVIVSLIPGLAVAVRRLHDTGRSGGHLFLYFIPYVGMFILIFMFAQKSQPFYNAYGAPPQA